MTIRTKALLNHYVVDVADAADVAAGVTLLPLGFASQNPSRCSGCIKGSIAYEMNNYKNNNSHQRFIKSLYYIAAGVTLLPLGFASQNPSKP